MTLVGRHVFDLADGRDGKPPAGVDHVVVVTHRPEPEGWDCEAPVVLGSGKRYLGSVSTSWRILTW